MKQGVGRWIRTTSKHLKRRAQKNIATTIQIRRRLQLRDGGSRTERVSMSFVGSGDRIIWSDRFSLEARSRAKSRGLEFDIELEDIPPMGTHCPLLRHPFPPSDQRGTSYSPSLDRIDSAKGYVKGNVWIVGYRANLIKNDGSAEEHEMIAQAMRSRLAT